MAKGTERGVRIRIKLENSGYTDHHQDMGALRKNTGVDFRVQNELGTLLPLTGTDNKRQPVQSDIPSLLAAKVRLFVGAAFIAPIGETEKDFVPADPREFLQEYAAHEAVYGEMFAAESRLKPVTSVEHLWGDVIGDPANEAVGVIKSVEGLYVDHENWKDIIDELKVRGVQSVGIMWNFDTEVGCTAKDIVREKKEDTGLSELGRQVVAYIDQQDMLVDLSHASDETIKDVLEVLKDGKNPPIVTHSGSRAVVKHPRNIKDTDALEIYKRGGIIGIPFVGPFIGGETNADDVVRHIQHFKELGILDAIVLGSDFNGTSEGSEINALSNVTLVRENLTTAMTKAGFTEDEIENVLNRNAFDFWIKHLPSSDPREVIPSQA